MTSAINAPMNTRQWVKLVTLSALWGGSFFFVGIAVDELPPLTIVMLRVTFAAMTLGLIALFIGLHPPIHWCVWRAFLVMGLLNNIIPFTLIAWGQGHVASALASILNAATPLFTVIIAHQLLPDERVSPLKLIGVALGFIGVTVMIGRPAIDGESHWFAQMAILAATLSYALAGIYGRRFKAMAISPIITATGQVSMSALVLIPITFVVEGSSAIAAASLSTWSAIIGLAVFSTAGAYVLYFNLLASAGATNLLLVTLLIPVSAVLLGATLLDEMLQSVHFVGMALIALGLSAIDGRLWERARFARLFRNREK